MKTCEKTISIPSPAPGLLLTMIRTADATGPSSATTAILIIYDIFGFSPQGLQGADILAHSDSSHQYQVFIPDFFIGKPAEHAWYPPDTKEKGEKLGAFFKGPAAPPKTAEKIPSVVKEITEKTGGTINTWGALGMCWGGKVGGSRFFGVGFGGGAKVC